MAISKFSPEFTPNVINSIGPGATPRTREIFTSLFKHVHDFAREVELTTEEWTTGMTFLNAVGHTWFTSNGTRNEMHRLSDIIGLESLVDEIAHTHFSESADSGNPTSSSILGPFWSPLAPFRENGASIIQCPHEGIVCFMHGKVIDMNTKKGVPNAVVDLWQASSNGKYDFQDPQGQTPMNLRGKFRTDAEGNYSLYCLRPTPYSLPQDGPSWDLLKALDRHSMRPAHMHAMVSGDGYKQVVTQLFPKDDPWIETDSVFATKDDLVVDFAPIQGNAQAQVELKFDFVLVPVSS